MTRERIEDMREVVLPFVKKRLLEINYEGLGESDAKEFEREFNEILNLAIKALEQEPNTGHWKHDRANVRCSNCGRGYKEAVGRTSATTYNFCPNCGTKMVEPQKSEE